VVVLASIRYHPRHVDPGDLMNVSHPDLYWGCIDGDCFLYTLPLRPPGLGDEEVAFVVAVNEFKNAGDQSLKCMYVLMPRELSWCCIPARV
jgi:hypothetical protein